MEGRGTFEERISEAAPDFELRPLLALLHAHGYERHDIRFQSQRDGISSGSIVASVQFLTTPARAVVITLNMGLFGDNTLLPSYFFQVLEASPDPERFYDFIGFFDHKLLENMVRALHPEDESGAYRDFASVKRSFFRMIGPGSVATLQWLVPLVFPELRVHVSRRAFTSPTASHAFRTGQSLLDGTGILGKVYESDASGFLIDLYAEEETDARGHGWAGVVRERLRTRLLPILAPFHIPIGVRLRVLFHASWVRVDFPFSDEHGFLGYERIRGEADEGHTLLVYRGVPGEDEAD